MTDPTPYTDDDVEALAEAVHHPGLTNVSDDRDVARRPLDAGYRKVTPDTPPEPQERWTVIHTHWLHHRKTMRSWAMGDHVTAEYFRDLGNLDAKYEDQGGVGKALEKLNEALDQRDEARSKVEKLRHELGRVTAAREHWREKVERLTVKLAEAHKAMRSFYVAGDAFLRERDEARAEVERLTELLGDSDALVRSSGERIEQLEFDHRGALDRIAELAAEVERLTADPQDDGPTGPLFTGEILARKFHEAYERLAPEFDYRTREDSAKPWDDVPERNRLLMVAVCDEILHDLRPTDTPTSNPGPMPAVRGNCPGCGRPTLFVASGGYLTCSALECPDPTALADMLEKPQGAPTSNQPVTAELLRTAWRIAGCDAGRMTLSAAEVQNLTASLNDLLDRTPAPQPAAGEDA